MVSGSPESSVIFYLVGSDLMANYYNKSPPMIWPLQKVVFSKDLVLMDNLRYTLWAVASGKFKLIVSELISNVLFAFWLGFNTCCGENSFEK